MISPTGSVQIRLDPEGAGHFGASRTGGRLHTALDLYVEPGQNIVAPLAGKINRIVYPYSDDQTWKGIELRAAHLIVWLLYVEPKKELIGKPVWMGQVIGTAQDIRKRYSAAMLPHIHTVVYVDPLKLFVQKNQAKEKNKK